MARRRIGNSTSPGDPGFKRSLGWYGLTLALSFTFTGLAVTPASAQASCPPNFGPFAIDGFVGDTLGNPCNNSGVAPGATKTADPNGNVKELGALNASNTKVNVIHDAAPQMLDFTNPNGQTDLNAIYTQAKVHTDGKFYFYFGWARDANSGSGFISIELQRLAKPIACNYSGADIDMKLPMSAGEQALISSCNPWANRGEGDLLFTWDQQGNSTQVYLRTFDAALNTFRPAIPLVPGQDYFATYSADLFRGEISINLSAVVGGLQSECLTFANIIPGTVTGNSDTADYKDTVLAAFPVASNCGSVIVQKVTVPDSTAVGPFPFTLATSPARTIFGTPNADTDCSSGGLTSCVSSLAQGGSSVTISDLLAGPDYTLTENLAGTTFQLQSIVCVLGTSTYTITGGGAFPVAADSPTTCTITNVKQSGTLNIVKTVVNQFGLTKVPGDFSYTLDGAASFFTTTGLSGGPTCTSGQVCRTASFFVGTSHTVVEQTPPAGFTVMYSNTQNNQANCTNLTISSTPVTCTVTNTATQNTPSAVTRQRVLLFDRARAMGLRRVTGDDGTMSFKFAIYDTLAACEADTGVAGGIGSQIVSFNVAGTNTDSELIGTTTGIEIKKDDAGTLDTTRWWRAKFHQNTNATIGLTAPNADFVTPCTETTRILFNQPD